MIIRGINCRKMFIEEINSNKLKIIYDKQCEFFANKKIIKRRQMRILKFLVVINNKIRKCDNFKKNNINTVIEIEIKTKIEMN